VAAPEAAGGLEDTGGGHPSERLLGEDQVHAAGPQVGQPRAGRREGGELRRARRHVDRVAGIHLEPYEAVPRPHRRAVPVDREEVAVRRPGHDGVRRTRRTRPAHHLVGEAVGAVAGAGAAEAERDPGTATRVPARPMSSTVYPSNSSTLSSHPPGSRCVPGERGSCAGSPSPAMARSTAAPGATRTCSTWLPAPARAARSPSAQPTRYRSGLGNPSTATRSGGQTLAM
jgi:hypothetical protein